MLSHSGSRTMSLPRLLLSLLGLLLLGLCLTFISPLPSPSLWAPRPKPSLITAMLQIQTNTQPALSTYIFHKYLKPDLPKTELIIILSKLGHYPEFSIPAIPLASTHLLKPETWGFFLTLLQHSWITAAVAIFHYMAWETEKAGLK